jgi:hypothetical protein
MFIRFEVSKANGETCRTGVLVSDDFGDLGKKGDREEEHGLGGIYYTISA